MATACDRGCTKRELADCFGISPHTIDKYRKLGFVPKTVPPKGGRARYYAQHFEAVLRIVVRREGNFILVGNDGQAYGPSWRERWVEWVAREMAGQLADAFKKEEDE